MNILFVCKFNRFRSTFSEAFFKKLDKSSKYNAKSAGLIKGRPISKSVKECASELGIRIKKEPEGITSELLDWADIIVVVADNVPSSIFKEPKKKKAKLIRWNVRDVYSGKKEDIKKRALLIKKKVERLFSGLEN